VGEGNVQTVKMHKQMPSVNRPNCLLTLFKNRCNRVGPRQHGGVFDVVDNELDVDPLLLSCHGERQVRIGAATWASENRLRGQRVAGSCKQALGIF
jgi:hypothetical protein